MIDKIIVDNAYYHFCLKHKGWCVYRFHIPECPFCGYKNPELIPKSKRVTLVKTYDGKEVYAFENDDDAIKYVNEHYGRPLLLTDVGFVPK